MPSSWINLIECSKYFIVDLFQVNIIQNDCYYLIKINLISITLNNYLAFYCSTYHKFIIDDFIIIHINFDLVNFILNLG